jgi:hypothetical protein
MFQIIRLILEKKMSKTAIKNVTISLYDLGPNQTARFHIIADIESTTIFLFDERSVRYIDIFALFRLRIHDPRFTYGNLVSRRQTLQT